MFLVFRYLPLRWLSLQALTHCDNIRIPVVFRDFDNCNIVGEITGFSNDSETTISGIVSIIEKAPKITNDIVDKLRAYGCFA